MSKRTKSKLRPPRKAKSLRDQIFWAIAGETLGVDYDMDMAECLGRNQIRIVRGSKSWLLTLEKEQPKVA